MNVIINQQDLNKGLSPMGTYTREQASMFGSKWNKETGWSDNPIGKRCRAETMMEFIDARSRVVIEPIEF